MGLQHYTQDTSKLPLKYNINVLFYTKYTHPTLICRGTDARTHGRTDGRTDAQTDGRTHGRKIFTPYSGISSCSLGSTDRGVITVLGDSNWSRGLVLRVPSKEKILKRSICCKLTNECWKTFSENYGES